MPVLEIGTLVFFASTGAYTVYQRWVAPGSSNQAPGEDQHSSDSPFKKDHSQSNEQALIARAKRELTDPRAINISLIHLEVRPNGELIFGAVYGEKWRILSNLRSIIEDIKQRSPESDFLFGVVPPEVAQDLLKIHELSIQEPDRLLARLTSLMNRSIVLNIDSKPVKQFLRASQRTTPLELTPLAREKVNVDPLSVLDAKIASPVSSQIAKPPTTPIRHDSTPFPSGTDVSSMRLHRKGKKSDGTKDDDFPGVELGSVSHRTRPLNSDEKELINKGEAVFKNIIQYHKKAEKILGNFGRRVTALSGDIVPIERKVENFTSAMDLLNSSLVMLDFVCQRMNSHMTQLDERHDDLEEDARSLFSSKLAAFNTLAEKTRERIATLNEQKESFLSSKSPAVTAPIAVLEDSVEKKETSSQPRSKPENKAAKRRYEQQKKEKEQRVESKSQTLSTDTGDFTMGDKTKASGAKAEHEKKESTLKMKNINGLLARLDNVQLQAHKILDDIEEQNFNNEYFKTYLEHELVIFSKLDIDRINLTQASEYEDPEALVLDVTENMRKANAVLTKLSNFFTREKEKEEALKQSVKKAVEIASALEPSTLFKGALALKNPDMPQNAQNMEDVVDGMFKLLLGDTPFLAMITQPSSSEALTQYEADAMVPGELMASGLVALRQELISKGYDEAAVDNVLQVLSMLTRGQVLVVACDNALNVILSNDNISETLFQILKSTPKQIHLAALSVDQAAALLAMQESGMSQGLPIENAVLALRSFEKQPVNPEAIQLWASGTPGFPSALTLPENFKALVSGYKATLSQVAAENALNPLDMLRIFSAVQMVINPDHMREARRLLEVQQNLASVKQPIEKDLSMTYPLDKKTLKDVAMLTNPGMADAVVKAVQEVVNQISTPLSGGVPRSLDAPSQHRALYLAAKKHGLKPSDLFKMFAVFNQMIANDHKISTVAQAEMLLEAQQHSDPAVNVVLSPTPETSNREDSPIIMPTAPGSPKTSDTNRHSEEGQTQSPVVTLPHQGANEMKKRNPKTTKSTFYKTKKPEVENYDDFANQMQNNKTKPKTKSTPSVLDTKVAALNEAFLAVQSQSSTASPEVLDEKIKALSLLLQRDTKDLDQSQYRQFEIKLADLRRALKERRNSEAPAVNISDLHSETGRLVNELRLLLSYLSPASSAERRKTSTSNQAIYERIEGRVSEIRSELERIDILNLSAREQALNNEALQDLILIDKQLMNLRDIINASKDTTREDKIVDEVNKKVSEMSDQEVAFALVAGLAAMAGGSAKVIKALTDVFSQHLLLDNGDTESALVASNDEQQVAIIRQQIALLRGLSGLDVALIDKIEQLIVAWVNAGKNPAEYRLVLIQNGRATYIRPDVLTPESVKELLRGIQAGDMTFRLVPIEVAAQFEAVMAQAGKHSRGFNSDEAALLLDHMTLPQSQSGNNTLAVLKRLLPGVDLSALTVESQSMPSALKILARWKREDAALSDHSSAADMNRGLLLLMGSLFAYTGQEKILGLMQATIDEVGNLGSVPTLKMPLPGPLPEPVRRQEPLEIGGGTDKKGECVIPIPTPPKENDGPLLSLQDAELERLGEVTEAIRKIFTDLENDNTVPVKHLEALKQLHMAINDGMIIYLISIEKNQNGKKGFNAFYQTVTASVARAEKQFKDEGFVWNLIRPLLNAVIQAVNAIRKHVMGVPEYGLFKSKSTQAFGDSKTIKQFKAQLETEKKWNDDSPDAPRAAGSGPNSSK